VTASLATGPVAFVDVETTGGHPAYHRVTEVAIVAARDGELEWRWSQLVNPGVTIPPSIQALTGISNDMVADAPPFERIAGEVLERLQGRLFIAHNARFDYGFLRGELRRAGHRWQSPLACTVKLSRRLDPELPRHNLDTLIAHHGFACETRHRALPDADALWQIWSRWLAGKPRAEFDAAIAAVSQRTALPPQLPADLADDLPEAPGVYRFYGAAQAGSDEALIYVGKANNLRERVLSHFAGAHRDTKSRRLSEQTQRVEWTETAGELGALLLEARLVRELQPVYNRRLRGASEAWTWVIPDGGAAPRLTDLDADGLGADDAFGLYRTERQARTALTRLARDHKLCLKVLGLEAGSGSCFGFQIGRCAGACAGVEPLPRHGVRVKLALAPLKLRSWPYRGAVGVHESTGFGLTQVHVIDRWQYLGSMLEGEAFVPSFAPDARFDTDAYRILVRHLTPRARNVRLLAGAARRPPRRDHEETA
jgi:DNA polymerase-3 subunit epsilon